MADFTNAEKIGDAGTTVREGSLGKLYGTNWMLAQNAPSIDGDDLSTLASAVNLTAGYDPGDTSLVVTAFTTEWADYVGGWCTIAGDMTPQKIISATDGTETIVISPGLKYAVVDTAVITAYKNGKLDEAHALGRVSALSYDGIAASKGPQAGQLLSISTVGAVESWSATNTYAALAGPTITGCYSDVPLAAAALAKNGRKCSWQEITIQVIKNQSLAFSFGK